MDLLLYILLFATVSGLIYTALAVYISYQNLKISGNNTGESQRRPISILKPLKGLDDRLEENLRSFFELSYPKFELLFGVTNPKDPALEVVKKLQTLYPEIPAKIIFGNNQDVYNPKVNNLLNLYAVSQYPLIMISDSNTRVERSFLNKLVNYLDDQKVGLVTATIRGVGAGNFSAVMENLHLNSFLMPNVFAVKKIFGVTLAIGKCMLMPRKLLEEMGGFFAFGKYLAEDFMIARKVKEMNYKVVNAPVILDTINEKWAWDRFINRHSRWAKMRKKINWKHYFAETFNNPIISALLLLLVFPATGTLLVFLCTALLKILLDYFAGRQIASDLKWYHYFLVPFKDLIISLVWYLPLITNKVEWRGNQFKLLKNSELKPIF